MAGVGGAALGRLRSRGPHIPGPATELRHRHMRLERQVIDGGRKKAVLENPIGITKAAGNVPFALLEQVNDIGALQRSRRHVRPPRYDAPWPWVQNRRSPL